MSTWKAASSLVNIFLLLSSVLQLFCAGIFSETVLAKSRATTAEFEQQDEHEKFQLTQVKGISPISYCLPLPTSVETTDTRKHGREFRDPNYEDKRSRNKFKGRYTVDEDDGGTESEATSYDRDGKYWLVPPFLIGASSIVVAYVIIHCLYMHCSCSDDRRREPTSVLRGVQIATTAPQHGRPPRIVLSNPDNLNNSGAGHLGASTAPRMIPLVSYEGASYGQRQLVEAQPFLIYEPYDDIESPPLPSNQQPKRKSALLQLPQAIGRKLSQARVSFSSVGTPYREQRASICFVPVGRTLSDPSGATNLTFADGNQSHTVLIVEPSVHPESNPHCNACRTSTSSSVGSHAPVGSNLDEGTATTILTSPLNQLPVIDVDGTENSSVSPATTDGSKDCSCHDKDDPA